MIGTIHNFKKLLAPALFFMGRRSYVQKFALLGVLFAIPLVVAFSWAVSKEYQHIFIEQQKVAGIKYVNSLRILLLNVGQHRGMSSALIVGDETFAEKRAEVAGVITQNIVALSSRPGFIRDGDTEESAIFARRIEKLSSGWKILQEELVTANTAQESFALHTAYIQTIISFIREVGDTAGLFLGTEPIDHSLAGIMVGILPEMSENIGQSRSYGTGIPHGRKLTEEEKRQFVIFLTKTEKYFDELEREVAFILREQPALAPPLSGIISASGGAVSSLMNMYKKEFIESDERTIDNEAYWRITTGAIDATMNTYDTLLYAYTTVSDTRIREYGQERNMVSAVIVFSLLLAVYLFTGFYTVFKRTLSSLNQTTKKILAGTHGEHIEIIAHDELGEISQSFNEIMDAFLEVNRKLVQLNSELKEHISKQKETEERLKDRAVEVDRFNRLMIGRELKMVDLKEEILALREQLTDSTR